MKEIIQAEHLNIKYLNKAPADKLRENKKNPLQKVTPKSIDAFDIVNFSLN